MPAMNEDTQVGVFDSWEEVVANVESVDTPFTSMLQKTKKTGDARVTNSQIEAYPNPNTEGVPDGKDATDPESNPRKTVDSVIQKVWRQPAVSDISQEMDVHAVSDEMARQITTYMAMLKLDMECCALSDHECRDFDNIGNDEGYKTRGAFKWLETDEQSTRPVPDGYRPGARYTGTLTNFDFDELQSLSETAAIERKGKADMIGIVGLKLKGRIAKFLRYQDDASSQHGILSVNMDAAQKTYLSCVDRVETDGANIDLFPSFRLRYSQAKSAEPSDGTNLSGLFLIKDMWSIDYLRAPRVAKLPYLGGGHKAIIDAIFQLRCKNALGQFSAVIDS